MQRCGMAILPPPQPPSARPMIFAPPRQSLLEELETRQNEVLLELDRLNARIELVLRDCLAVARCGPPEPTVSTTGKSALLAPA
jgi:hypothetical protein